MSTTKEMISISGIPRPKKQEDVMKHLVAMLLREYNSPFHINMARPHGVACLKKPGIRIRNFRDNSLCVDIQPEAGADAMVMGFIICPDGLSAADIYKKVTNGGSKRIIFLDELESTRALPKAEQEKLDAVVKPAALAPAPAVIKEPEPDRGNLIGWSKDETNVGMAILTIHEEAQKRVCKCVPLDGIGKLLIEKLNLDADPKVFGPMLNSWTVKGLLEIITADQERCYKVTNAGLEAAGVRREPPKPVAEVDMIDRMAKVIQLAKEHRDATARMSAVREQLQAKKRQLREAELVVDRIRKESDEIVDKLAEIEQTINSADHKRAVHLIEAMREI